MPVVNHASSAPKAEVIRSMGVCGGTSCGEPAASYRAYVKLLAIRI
jgi:hypothetical protein